MNEKYYAKYEEIINDICQQITPGKKMIQKLMYLIERKGVDLNLNYCIHFYGPYSATLDDALHTLEALGRLNILVDGVTHQISITESDRTPNVLSQTDKAKVRQILNTFGSKTAFELEALTTLDYVSHTLLSDSGDMEQTIAKVMNIKGSKFRRHDLEQKYCFLQEQKFIPEIIS